MSMNMWSKNASLAGATLSLAGIPAAQLAKDFGTPSFFLDEDAFRSDYGMISRSVLSNVITKTLGKQMDIEYRLGLAF